MRLLLVCLVLLAPAWAQTDEDLARLEIERLEATVAGFHRIALPAEGVALRPEDSLTVERLRGVTLDPEPPTLGPLATPYEAHQTDDFAPGEAPYVAEGIEPFRFREFHCELNYTGWHNFAFHDYGITHGFDILAPYIRTLEQRARAPEGTGWLLWGGFVNWDSWLPAHGIEHGRYDLLVGRDLVAELLDEGYLGDRNPAEWEWLMIDLEHGLLSEGDLRAQAWFPRDASAEEQAAFVARYYEGYAQTYIAPVQAAAQRSFTNISLYGWQPFQKAWYGLEDLHFDPATYGQWERFGRAIYREPSLAVLNPDLYVYYWSPQNVAFTLTQIDLCRALIETEPIRKPLRPYYWTLLHGGDADYHWWSNQPVADEDARAWTLFCLLSGCDGFDLWNWSDVGDHHHPRPFLRKEGEREVGSDIMVGAPFSLRAEGAEAPTDFARYDAIDVTAYDAASDTVRFQKIAKEEWGSFGIGPDRPTYAMAGAELRGYLRSESEPMAAVVEGMALARPLESLLRRGEVKVDVPSLKQFVQTLPIVRRVKLGRWHVVATYDPQVVHGGAPREIVLEDFDGVPGRRVVLPADAETRVFVLEER